MEGLTFSDPNMFDQSLSVFLILFSTVGIAGGIFIAWKNTRRHEKRKRDEMRSDNFQ